MSYGPDLPAQVNANRDADRPCGSSYDERTDYRSGRFRQVGQPVGDDADTKVDLIGIEFRLASTQAAVPKMLARGSGSALLTGGAFALQPRPKYLSLSIGKVGIRALSQRTPPVKAALGGIARSGEA